MKAIELKIAVTFSGIIKRTLTLFCQFDNLYISFPIIGPIFELMNNLFLKDRMLHKINCLAR